LTILIGSTRPAKVDGVREALDILARVDPSFAHADIQVHDLTSIAPRMPMSVAEILDGARRRASALFERVGNARDTTFAVGLEGGMATAPVDDRSWSLQTWAAVYDGRRWGYGSGPAIVLPTTVSDRVAAGEELGDVIDELAAAQVRGTRGAWGVLTRDLIGRRDAFRLAVIAAFARFYNAGVWPA
jgi:inosine/xanthosine triphosphatase